MREKRTTRLTVSGLIVLTLGFWEGGPLGTPLSAAQAQTAPSRLPPWVGMWSGRSIIVEKSLDDPDKQMTRSSDADFWIVIDSDGQARGEGFVTYAAELRAIRWKVDVPQVGMVEAQVAGSSARVTKRIGIRGTLADSPGRDHDRGHRDCSFTLALNAMGQGEDGQPAPESNSVIPGVAFDFVIQASVTVPPKEGTGGPPAAAAATSLQHVSLPAKGWSPFQGLKAKVERGPGEPLRVMAEDRGEKHQVLWYAVRQSVR